MFKKKKSLAAVLALTLCVNALPGQMFVQAADFSAGEAVWEENTLPGGDPFGDGGGAVNAPGQKPDAGISEEIPDTEVPKGDADNGVSEEIPGSGIFEEFEEEMPEEDSETDEILTEDPTVPENPDTPESDFESATEIFVEGAATDAVTADNPVTGTCGDNLTWNIAGGTLTISGTGDMWDFSGMPGWGPWGASSGLFTNVAIGEGVTSIGKGAFYACGIDAVNFPSTLRKIGESAFFKSGLTGKALNIPAAVTEIGPGAFKETGITTAIVNGALTEIGDAVFAGCVNLASVSLPDTLTMFSREMFSGCSSLVSLTIPKNLKKVAFKAIDNCDCLTSLVFPEGLQSLDNFAVCHNDSLSRVYLPSTVTSMQYGRGEGFDYGGVFKYNALLKTAGPTSEYNIELGWKAGDTVPMYAFACAELTQAVLPKGVNVSEGMFRECANLEKVIFPSGVNIIGKDAFLNCESLAQITIPDTVTTILDNAFSGSGLTSLTIPGSVKEWGMYVFERCKKLTSLTISEGITTIPMDGFIECTGLTTVKLPETLTTIGAEAFAKCSTLKRVNLPASLTKIGYNVFGGCTSLLAAGPAGGDYNLQYDWTEAIPENGFYGSEITNIVFPKDLKEIGYDAFDDCKRLKQVRLPEGLTDLNSLFSRCSALKQVYIPASVKNIREHTFSSCPSLKRMIVRSQTPGMISWDAFYDSELTVYYPKSNIAWEKYVSANKAHYTGKVTWKPFEKGFPMDDSKERSMTVNGEGTATGRFHLTDDDGYIIPEQEFTYTMRDEKYVYEYTQDGFMTDLDGGYEFTTPYYSYTPGQENIHDVEICVSWTDENGKEKEDTFFIHVTMEALSYSESWSLSLGEEAGIGDYFSYGNGSEAKITLDHNGNGTQDLTLALELTDEKSLSGSDKISPEVFKDVTFAKTSASGAREYVSTYETIIYNFNPGDKTHQEMLSCYLSMIFGVSSMENARKGNIWFSKMLDKSFLYQLSLQSFSVTSSGIKVKGSTGLTLLELKYKGSFLEPVKLGAGKLGVTYSSSKSSAWDPELKKKVITSSSNFKSEQSFSLLSGNITGLTGYTGLSFPGWNMCQNSLQKLSASVNDQGVVSFGTCDFDSGWTDNIGYDQVYRNDSYKAEGESAKALIEKSNGLKLLSLGIPVPMATSQYANIAKNVLESKETISHSVTNEMTNSMSWSPSFELSSKDKNGAKAEEKKGIDISLKFSLSGSYGCETEVSNDQYKSDVVLQSVDSANSVEAVRKQGSNTQLSELFGAALSGYANLFSDAIKFVTNPLSLGVKIGLAEIVQQVNPLKNLNVSLLALEQSDSGVAAATSYSIATFEDTAAVGEETVVTANTVGDPYIVHVTDGDNNDTEIKDFSDCPLDLVLGYTEADLSAAGTTAADADKLSVYYYEEETQAYIYAGGTVDTAAGTVSAQITKAGQYVLAADGAAPVVSEIAVTNVNTEPVITAMISDFTGISAIEMSLDGIQLVTAENYKEFYDSKTNIFAYQSKEALTLGEHTVVFKTTDSKEITGNEVVHTFTVTRGPVFKDIQVQPYALKGDLVQIQAVVQSQQSDYKGNLWSTVDVKYYDSDRKEKHVDVTLTETDGVWKGNFQIAKDVNGAYEVVWKAYDEAGNVTVSDTYRCMIPSDNIAVYTTGNTTWKANLLIGQITECTTTDINVEIPSKIFGHEIFSIACYAFDGCSGIKTVKIPEGITWIGDGAFSGCTGLTKVTLPETLTELGDDAFYGCSALTEVTFGSRIQDLGSDVFGGCTNLKVIYGYTHTPVEEYEQFESIGIGELTGSCGTNTTYMLRKDTLTISGNGEISERFTASEYPWYDFKDQIKNLVIEEGVTSIPYDAFYYCEDLENVTIGKSVTYIDSYAFGRYISNAAAHVYYGTAAWKWASEQYMTIVPLGPVGGGIEESPGVKWNFEDGVLTVKGEGSVPAYETANTPWESLFDSITKIVIGDGITSIGKYAFGYRPSYYEPYLSYNGGIYGSKGSAAETYAKENGIAFFSSTNGKASMEEAYMYLLSGNRFVYQNGKPIEPYVEVYYRNLVLEEDKDYTVSYKDNIKPGTGRVIVTGIGRFEGQIEETFTITKATNTINLNGFASEQNTVTAATAKTYNIRATAKQGSVTYQSSDSAVKVNSTGTVTIPAYYVGEVEITVKSPETESLRSSSAWITITVVPAQPSVKSLTVTSSGVTVNWNTALGAGGYQIYRNGTKIATVNGSTAASYTDKAAKTNGVRYQYQVQAVRTKGSATYAGEKSAVKITYYLGKVYQYSPVNETKGVKVKWKPITGASGYYVYRNGKYIKNITSGKTSSYTDTKAKTSGSKYQYQVKAYKKAAEGAFYGDKSSTKTTYYVSSVKLYTPKNLFGRKLSVKWTKNRKASGYEVKYVTGSSSKTVKVKGASSVNKVLTSLKKGKTYKVYVRAYKTVSKVNYYSPWSTYKKVKIAR